MTTERKQRCLKFIEQTIEATGLAPTLREIASGMGFKSPANAHWLVKSLEVDGSIKRVPGRHRAIELVPKGRVVTLSPDTHFLAARRARKQGASIDQVANDLLRGALTDKQEAC